MPKSIWMTLLLIVIMLDDSGTETGVPLLLRLFWVSVMSVNALLTIVLSVLLGSLKLTARYRMNDRSTAPFSTVSPATWSCDGWTKVRLLNVTSGVE